MIDFDFHELSNASAYLARGMALTAALTGLSAVLGLILGAFVTVLRLSPVRILSKLATLYVNLIRSIPLILVIFWFYFLVPYVGAWLTGASQPIQVGAFRSAIVGFTIFEAAYFSEILRAGVQSIGRGQIFAGQALGMSYGQTLINVIIPQAIRNMIPSISTRIIIIFQDTSLVYVLGMTDFLGAATQIGQRDGRLTELYVFVAIVYFLICFLASRFVMRVDNKISLSR